MRGRSSALMPGPVSSTTISTPLDAGGPLTATRPPGAVYLTALSIRLANDLRQPRAISRDVRHVGRGAHGQRRCLFLPRLRDTSSAASRTTSATDTSSRRSRIAPASASVTSINVSRSVRTRSASSMQSASASRKSSVRPPVCSAIPRCHGAVSSACAGRAPRCPASSACR